MGRSSRCIWSFRENILSCKYLICIYSLEGSGGYIKPSHDTGLGFKYLFSTGVTGMGDVFY